MCLTVFFFFFFPNNVLPKISFFLTWDTKRLLLATSQMQSHEGCCACATVGCYFGLVGLIGLLQAGCGRTLIVCAVNTSACSQSAPALRPLAVESCPLIQAKPAELHALNITIKGIACGRKQSQHHRPQQHIYAATPIKLCWNYSFLGSQLLLSLSRKFPLVPQYTVTGRLGQLMEERSHKEKEPVNRFL